MAREQPVTRQDLKDVMKARIAIAERAGDKNQAATLRHRLRHMLPNDIADRYDTGRQDLQ